MLFLRRAILANDWRRRYNFSLPVTQPSLELNQLGVDEPRSELVAHGMIGSLYPGAVVAEHACSKQGLTLSKQAAACTHGKLQSEASASSRCTARTRAAHLLPLPSKTASRARRRAAAKAWLPLQTSPRTPPAAPRWQSAPSPPSRGT